MFADRSWSLALHHFAHEAVVCSLLLEHVLSRSDLWRSITCHKVAHRRPNHRLYNKWAYE